MLDLTTVSPEPLSEMLELEAANVNATACVGSSAAPSDWNQTLEWGCGAGTTVAPPPRRRSSTPYYLAWWQQLAWSTVFAVMVIVAVGGNSIVMWIVLAHRRMRTVTNYFLVNLSVADLLMAVFNCIFNFVYMLNSDWQFGRSYCTINNFVANVTVAASVFTLTGISIDRYLAIVRPLQPRMSKLSARITIVVIWVASATLGFPCLLYSTTITYKSRGGQIRTACIMMWPDGQPMVSTMDYAYNLVLFIVTYVIPMSAMAGCYTAMGRELWGSRSIGEMTQRQIDSIRSKRKVVRMFIIIVLIFAVCWLPYHAYFIYTHHYSSIAFTKYVQHLFLAFYWLAMANSMVNPLIYYWMNARFRGYFNHAVCVWNCALLRRQKPVELGAETPPMLARYSHSYSRSRSGTADECHPRNGHRVASSSNGVNNPGRQVCVCVEQHSRPTNPNRPISDLSGGGGGRSHSHHGGRRCRFGGSGGGGGAGRNNNGSGVVGATRDPNYWRNRNKMLFEMNAERRDERPQAGEEIEICAMAASAVRVPIVDRKETMETSVDV